MPNPSKYPCCCGLSATFPTCDGTKTIAKTNAPGKLVQCGAPRLAAAPGGRPAGRLDGEISASTPLAIDALIA
jgi:hypothetical protein